KLKPRFIDGADACCGESDDCGMNTWIWMQPRFEPLNGSVAPGTMNAPAGADSPLRIAAVFPFIVMASLRGGRDAPPGIWTVNVGPTEKVSVKLVVTVEPPPPCNVTYCWVAAQAGPGVQAMTRFDLANPRTALTNVCCSFGSWLTGCCRKTI